MKKPAHKTLCFLRACVTHRLFVYCTVTFLLALLAFWRNPLYLTTPNFYAEDGLIFAQTILDKGFLQALITPFNGYFISGIYVLEGLGFVINTLFLGGGILNQPAALAFVSYGFWAAVCSLPLLLFWRELRHKNWLILIGLALALLPLPSFGYAVLGTIGNYKFAFLFIAFLLLLKRHWLSTSSRWFYAIDALLVLCAFTNATTYLLLPFALVRYWPGHKQVNVKALTGLLRQKSMISLIAMGIFAALQLIYIALQGGVDTLQGYLQEPFEFHKAVEIFIQRTYLFPFTHIFSTHLNNILVTLLFIASIIGLWKIAHPKDRIILYFGLYAAGTATLLFVSQRTGVSQFFTNYTTSGTDHFFYPQNWIFLFTALFIVTRAADTARPLIQLLAITLLAATPGAMLLHNDFGYNISAERSVGSLWSQAQIQCSRQPRTTMSLPIYPQGAGLTMPIASSVCNSDVENYIPGRLPLPLAPANNNYVILTSHPITQTFTATHNQLAGVSVYFSSFGSKSSSTYRFDLLDATCRHTLRSHTFNALDIQDNSYYDLRVSPIIQSKNNRYCFKITPLFLEPGRPPLAQQLSAPNRYLEGNTYKEGKTLAEDIVFDVLYK